MQIDRPDFVRITNLLGKGQTLYGRFDSVDYEFRFNEPTDVHIEVAKHIFGFTLKDKGPALQRLGWMASSADLKTALEKLTKVRFQDAPPLIEAPAEDPIAESAGELLPHGTGGAGPLAKGGDGGGSGMPPPHPPRK